MKEKAERDTNKKKTKSGNIKKYIKANVLNFSYSSIYLSSI